MQKKIPEKLVGQRLDKVVVELFPEITRSQVKKMIEGGDILLNKVIVKPHILTKQGDSIVVNKVEPVVREPVVVLESPRVIEETDEYLIINKPAGLTVHPASRHVGLTLVDWLIASYPYLEKIGEDPVRPAIVHRLDKDASGIMVIPKTNESYDSLKRQFKTRTVKKEYLILVHGVVQPTEGEIHSFLQRSKQQFTRYAASTNTAGREALTRYWVEKSSQKFSLVRVLPETGRTHQIRVHFFSRGYPLVGDMVYHGKNKEVLSVRLMLHARSIKFRLLDGAVTEYICEPDTIFQGIVDDLLKKEPTK